MNIKPNITVPATVERVVDGDTVELFVCTKVMVRLEDCWCPERHEKEGVKATRYTESLLPSGGKCLLSVDLTGVDQLHDVFTFGRVVGRIYIDGIDVSESLIENNLATREKKK